MRVYSCLALGLLLAGCQPAGLSAEKQWALATSAILTERNGERHDILGGIDRTEQSIDAIKTRLRDWWSIDSRDSLLTTLKWLEEGGHRRDFERLAAAIGSMSREEYLDLLRKSRHDEDASDRLGLVSDYAAKLGPKGLLGWDYGRYVSLCRWGYVAGYATEEEAWDLILPAARKLRQTFDSWADLGANYLVGRAFWSPGLMRRDGQLYRNAYQTLLSSPQSPWVLLPWNLTS